MKFLQRVAAVVGTVFAIAVMVAIVAPKTARAIAAAMVVIVPGTTTHVGQSESQIVSLGCSPVSAGMCSSISPTGAFSPTAYTVPAGYTLIVTDWEFFVEIGGAAGNAVFDNLVVTNSGPDSGNFVYGTEGTTINGGYAHEHERFTTGIRVPSGWQIQDTLAKTQATGYMQGYLVPN